MRKSTYILVGIILILIAGIISLSVWNSHLRSEDYQSPVDTGETDTVYVSRFFDREIDFEFDQIPERVFVFFSDTTEVERVILKTDTLTVYQKDSSSIQYSTLFLTQYPESSKLIQMTLSDKLRMTMINPQGNIYQEVYSIDLDRFKYSYSSHLTYQKKSFWKRWTPFAQLQVRPFHSWIDLDFGLIYKTSNLQYEFGINGFYYHHLNNPVGADLFLRMRYEF